jgi:hypothetical protein
MLRSARARAGSAVSTGSMAIATADFGLGCCCQYGHAGVGVDGPLAASSGAAAARAVAATLLNHLTV